MGTLGTVAISLLVGFVLLVVAMQVWVQVRARALAGQPLPPLPGGVGERISRSKRALVYFFSPSCGACRPITPRVRDLEKKNPAVFAIDVSRSLDLAQALRVMATPSTVEIAEGKIVAVHIGPIPDEVMARFG